MKKLMKRLILICIFFLFFGVSTIYAQSNATRVDSKSKYLIEEKFDVKDVISKLEEAKQIVNQINNPKLNKNLLIQDLNEIINNLKVFVK